LTDRPRRVREPTHPRRGLSLDDANENAARSVEESALMKAAQPFTDPSNDVLDGATRRRSRKLMPTNVTPSNAAAKSIMCPTL